MLPWPRPSTPCFSPIYSDFKKSSRGDTDAPSCSIQENLDASRERSELAIAANTDPDLYKLAARPRRYLVFTSAGNRNAVPSWIAAARDFDLWVVWYGDGPDRLEPGADYYLRRAGSKWQNLHYCYLRWPELFDQYEAIMVMDDDIWLSPAKIDRLFDVRRRHDLWALQPAFSPFGKISYGITRVRRDVEIRFVDFIENTCPLFRTDKLRDFMRVYDPELVSWGCGWWFLHSMGQDLRDRIAIVDSIVCVNPRDWWKAGGDREIDRLQSTQKRRETWERIRRTHGISIDGRGQSEFRVIRRQGLSRWLMCALGLIERFPVITVGTATRAWARLNASPPWRKRA